MLIQGKALPLQENQTYHAMTAQKKTLILAMLFLLAFCPCAWAQKVSVTIDTVDAGRTGYRVPVTATFGMVLASLAISWLTHRDANGNVVS